MSAAYPRALRRVDRTDVAPRRTVVRLWLPLTPLFLLLAPFALLLAPLGYFVPPRLRPDPFFAVFALGELLLALGGTDLLIDTPDAYVRIKIL
jgi:peptidoglycan/LPS O-acetylase OafA/YrhL